MYYSRPDIRKALYEFSSNRETIPRYYEGFGKRPDTFQYQNDVLEQVKRGATSFHSSEELWEDPLEIETNMSRQQLNDLRIGWDLLLDIDSPYLEYSKIYTQLLVEAIKFHNIENFEVKFSGSKGFHLIIPWKAFPEEIYNQKTKDMFPEWPRIICQYLASIIQPKLSEKLFENQTMKQIAEKTGRAEDELVIDECVSCHRQATKKQKVTFICNSCKHLGELTKIEKTKRIPLCPECRKPLIEENREEILFCQYCNFTSDKKPEMFNKAKKKTEILIDADLVLVAPRHLFRMPYSLHEKTSMASIVIDKNKITEFQITDAKPLKVTTKPFYPIPKPNEAKDLLLQALDWHEQQEKEETKIQEQKETNQENRFQTPTTKKQGEYKKIEIPNPDPKIFPPQITLILKGLPQDGRKRALMVLISFFKSLGVKDIDIEKKILEWNELNYQPLKKGYILSQLQWYKRNPNRLPPNFNNPIYKDLGVDKPDQLAMQTKNPVSYAVKKYFSLGK